MSLISLSLFVFYSQRSDKMASKGPPSEAVVKERIITHMNADHIDSVSSSDQRREHVILMPRYRYSDMLRIITKSRDSCLEMLG